jgi:mono/diheme cytochrome c family protein
VVGDGNIIELGGESVYDTGHAIFHESANPNASMSCASCHPEGREDGRVWQFSDVGARRTQSIAGGILATAPFHWNGELDGFDSLMTDVFTGRMSGPELEPARKLAAARWIDSIPHVAISPVANVAAVERGKVLFNDAKTACGSCHSGARLTNNQSVDVGTLGMMQVPSLRGLAARAPYMHDGCAKTLEERFTNQACGGGDQHGQTSQLSTEQIADLVSYLETL